MTKYSKKEVDLVLIAFAFGLLGNLSASITYGATHGTAPTIPEWITVIITLALVGFTYFKIRK
jgi:hypothetical protein